MDPIILDAGDIFFPKEQISGIAGEQAKLRAKTLVKGYNQIGCEALNIGSKDFAAGTDFLMALKDSSSFPFISANIIDKASGELVFEPYRIIERNYLRFAVIGLTTSLPKHITDLDILDPYEVGEKYLNQIENKSDYQIILLNANLKEAAKAKNVFTRADFIFLSRVNQPPRKPTREDNSWPKLYKLGKQGKSLAILKINSETPDSTLHDITTLKNKEIFLQNRLKFMARKDTTKTLEELYADKPKRLAQIKRTKTELAYTQEKLNKYRNTLEFSFVSMDKKIGDDPSLLSMVNETLSAVKKLAVPNEAHRKIIKNKLDTNIKKQVERSLKNLGEN